MEDVYTLLCLRSAELSKVFDLRNLCFYKISLVMLLRAKKKYALCPNAAYLNS